ncbi:MAG: helix-turn-helix transcriptional regulator [Bacteroidales bacterium]|nr:helix-turn-helix transcriptional regulator [Bacteroidales bacterium]
MDARDILVANVDRLCREKGWKHFHLARKMGVKPESLSRSLNGLPRIDTIEKIAKALDVSIKSLFEDPDAIEGFVSVRGKLHRINSRAEFERAVKESRPKMEVHWTSTSDDGDDDGGLPF